ncbi:MAG: outer membrane beta-barrel protein [Cyclobacteriaceae bacterium]
MKKLLVFYLCLLSVVCKGQEPAENSTGFYADYMMGTYLLLDDVAYKSVFLNGFRLGKKTGQRTAVQVEYLLGNQEDRSGVRGTTHTANLQFLYFLNDRQSAFTPYLYIGGGFFEFKDFSRDKLGVAWNGGLGTEANVSDSIAAIAEFRYLNIGPLNLEGVNQIGVLWGIRLKF